MRLSGPNSHSRVRRLVGAALFTASIAGLLAVTMQPVGAAPPQVPAEAFTIQVSGTAVGFEFDVTAYPTDRWEVWRDGQRIGRFTHRWLRPVQDGRGFFVRDQPLGEQTYSVRAIGADGTAGVFTDLLVDVGAPDSDPPTRPDSLGYSITPSGGVQLRWYHDRGWDIAGSVVSRDGVEVAFVPPAEDFPGAFTDQSPSGSHTYRVRVRDTGGNLSEPRDLTLRNLGTDDVSRPEMNGSPTVRIEGEPGNRTAVLEWDEASDNLGIYGYLIHNRSEYEAWVKAPTTEWRVQIPPGWTENILYYLRGLRVTAQDTANNLSFQDLYGTQVIDDEAPTPPTNITAEVLDDTVTLGWDVGHDLVSMHGTLVHRDGEFIRFHTRMDQPFIDRNVEPGEHLYEFRSQDYPGYNNSEPVAITVIVPEPA